ncbi:fibronectin type III domain-containing protein [Clostridium cibarium]|uniref:Fibronectin type III domain-containing protein n=1 Tax=Clostridium cibarium TaxID=2762247 RepID=A0ABR8PVB6_9CLOT|nr:fibronectin type III domain-containing protein [Clostridium cibarium]MBD7912108.1 fibronectin type III domain-containing protein [Clostridium cibarium]
MKKFLKKVSLFTICAVCVNVLGLLSPFDNNDTKAYAETTANSVSQQKNIANQSGGNTSNKGVTSGLIKVWCSVKNSNSITLEWDKVSNESESITYEIYRDSNRLDGKVNGETKYTVKYLAPNQSYKFRIVAKNSSGKVVSKSNYLQEKTELESNPTPEPKPEQSHPETLIFVENQDFSKEISGNMEVKGCFLSNDRTLVNAKIFIDGLDKTGQIQDFLVGTERSDLELKYSNYSNVRNSGFSFEFDTYNIANGQHTLKLMFHETSKEFKINVNNIQRQVILDNSDYSQMQQGIINGSGYILSSYNPSDFSIGGSDFFGENADVYVDGKAQSETFDNKLAVGIYRDDVKKKNPTYIYADKCGFSFKIDTTKLSDGKHTVKLRFCSLEKEFTINVQNKYKDIIVEGINTSQIQSGLIKGTGYVLSSYDPSTFNDENSYDYNCKMYVDDQSVDYGNLIMQIKRDDIKQKYSDYKYSDKCGFSFTLNTLHLSNGHHKIKFKFIGLEKEFSINVQNDVADMVIEGIDTTKIQGGIIKGTGYIISSYDPSLIENNKLLFSSNCGVYIDGELTYNNKITTQLKRDDVKQRSPNYKYSDRCGFSFKIDTMALKDGQHKIKIKILNSEKEFTINVKNITPEIVIEGINSNQAVEGIITGTGYIISSYDPSEFMPSWEGDCNVLIDGKGQNEFMGNMALQVQFPRNDVKKKYPDYKYADKCGFSFTIDTGKFSNGKHKLKIKLKNVEKEIEININNKSNDIVVESTSKSNEGSGKFVVSGYVLSPYSPDQIKNTDDLFQDNNMIYIDGNLVSAWAIFGNPDYMITLGITRNDIKAKYPDYKYSGVSGFEIKIDNSVLAKLTNGSHKMKIVFKNISREFTFNKRSNCGDQFFDAAFYAEKYSDLKNAFGYDEGQLYNHFITYGIKEGRCASAVFDVKYYLQNNADLVAAFGSTNYEAAYNHFKTYGYKENRNLSPIFNMGYYCKNNPDVVKAFGTDFYSIMNHFLDNGMKEGRNGSENFILKTYKDKYQDLRNKYGENNKLYYFDYLLNGMSSGKIAK